MVKDLDMIARSEFTTSVDFFEYSFYAAHPNSEPKFIVILWELKPAAARGCPAHAT
jgi:hypothetical protein